MRRLRVLQAAGINLLASDELLNLRLDSDVVAWFRAGGKGHLTRMNAVLRAYVEAQKHGA
jgi:uncharacterized protein (DUF4415 family)